MHARHDVEWQVRSHDLPDKFETIGNGKRNAIHEAVCGHHDTWNPRDLFLFVFFFQVGDFEKEAQTAMIEAKKEIAIKQREAKVDGVGFGFGWSHGKDTFASLAFAFLSQGNAAIGVMQKLQGTTWCELKIWLMVWEGR